MDPRDSLAAYEHQAHIKTERLGSSTEYSITGDLSSVLQAIRGLFINFHPYGYGTRLVHMEMLSDGSYGALVKRANSAD